MILSENLAFVKETCSIIGMPRLGVNPIVRRPSGAVMATDRGDVTLML